ncbi:MAG: NHL repeat-containing protein [Candidatus Zixiibacteriota bacterium]
MRVLRRSQPLLFAFLFLSCSHPPKPSFSTDDNPALPAALVVEREISGMILGKPLRYPFGLAVDAGGRVYVSDAGNSRVIKFDPNLKPEREIGGYGAQEGLFDRPSYLTVDRELSLLVSDEGNRRICRYDSYLQFVEALPFYDSEDPLKFGYPSGIALTEYGEVWAADRERNRIVVYDNVGTFDRFVGDFGYPGGQVANPEKIIKDIRGNFIVCDGGNRRLVVYDEYGNFSSEITDESLQYPVAAVSENHHLWILDSASGKVYHFDSRGKKDFEAGPRLAGTLIDLKEPSDIVLLSSGRLIISDSGNNRLLVCRVIYEGE